MRRRRHRFGNCPNTQLKAMKKSTGFLAASKRGRWSEWNRDEAETQRAAWPVVGLATLLDLPTEYGSPSRRVKWTKPCALLMHCRQISAPMSSTKRRPHHISLFSSATFQPPPHLPTTTPEPHDKKSTYRQ